jgi:chorismate-pyruvate lyase
MPPDLNALVHLFHAHAADLGQFHQVAADDMPEAMRRLFAHSHHMTVAMEELHRGPVDVEVLARHSTTTHYARQIILRRRSDRRPVQFGIMRISLTALTDEISPLIRSEKIPLGRVLIEHGVMRSVKVLSLWQIEPGPYLQQCLDQPELAECYGRTALIYTDGVPAVELLEVAPTTLEPPALQPD